VRRHDDYWIVRPCTVAEPLVEPGIEYGLEGEVGLFRIHDRGARIDAGFYSVALQNGEAEAMDRRGRKFAQAGSCAGERLDLSIAQTSLAKRRLQVFRYRYSAIDEDGGEFVDARTKLGGCTLREGDGGDARGACPAASSIATRPARSEVLPVPADASTRSVESRSVSARSRCLSSGLGVTSFPSRLRVLGLPLREWRCF